MNKTTNPFLKQLLAEISSKANDGRIDLAWNSLSKKGKVLIKEENNSTDPKKEKSPNDPSQENDLPDLGKKEAPLDKSKESTTEPTTDSAEPTSEEPSDKDLEKAQSDAVAKKAELEKAKAEKEQAEEELKKNSYVQLISSGGVNFLLGKLLNQAFKTDTIDALAGEMVQKLKIQTPEDIQAFSDEITPFKAIPGMGDLLSSMKSMATKTTKTPEEDMAV